MNIHPAPTPDPLLDDAVVVRWPDPSPLQDWWNDIMGIAPTRHDSPDAA